MKIGSRKLVLNRETLAVLKPADVGHVHGGAPPLTPIISAATKHLCGPIVSATVSYVTNNYCPKPRR